jgi:glucokinase
MAGAAGRRELVLALDIGGTKFAAAVVDRSGEVRGRTQAPVPPGGDAKELFAVLLGCADAALAGAGVERGDVGGVGCGSGGPMTWPAGAISPLNIPGWRAFPLRDRLLAAFPGRPVLVHNDAVAIAAGEHWRGSARDVANMIAVTVSTGVGGGLVIAGQLVHGASGNAGHIGHLVVDPDGPVCVCGGRGCLEAIASGPNAVRWAVEQGWRPPDGEPANGELLARSAYAGDGVAARAVSRAGDALGTALASCASLLDLEVAVVAGGFSQSGALFWDALRAAFTHHATMEFASRMEVRPSENPADVALQGAAAFMHAYEIYGWPVPGARA